tara:strand:- start:37797 stop:39761 length:1965 start_codon:yes stop_codon:yes gene_type:complete
MVKNLVLWLIIAVILISVFSNFGPRHGQVEKIPYSQFVEQAERGNVRSVVVDERSRVIRGVTQNDEAFTTNMLMDPYMVNELLKKKVEINAKAPEQQSLLMSIFISWFPIILFIGIWLYFMRQMQGGGGRGAMSFGKSRARMLGEDQIKVTFADVAGVDEAKEEVEELVEFLKDPEKFQKLGGRIPRGVLMVGQPGTGKTLLARAIAGEAKVPFFTISGSDFVEMFVGVGASRVRDMFEQAKKQSPCIIFIDEIDAVGRHRGAGLGGGHDEREQTLNQLLVEMDGFEGNEGVIVIAATNRPDVLDKALLRPGRFDRQVVVGLPDILGREQILKVHMRKIPVADDVEPRVIARGTPGFSGADLANLVNEAALFSARHNKRMVDQAEFDAAKDKILMGVERRNMAMSEDDRKLTAYHEAGHAIVALSVSKHDPVYKVTIIPRGQSLGLTMFLPEQDQLGFSKRELECKIATGLGGRIAEELVFGPEEITTGAASDIQMVTGIARNMVTKWGLSEKLGPLQYSQDQGEVFLGHSVSQQKEVSEKSAQLIDEETKAIIDRNYQHATNILQEKMPIMHKMAEALLKYETIDSKQLDDLMAGRPVREPQSWTSDKSNKPGSGGNATDTETQTASDTNKDANKDDKKRDMPNGDGGTLESP